MESDITRTMGGEGQELLTINKLFPTLEFFFTREGTSLVSQEAGGFPVTPQWEWWPGIVFYLSWSAGPAEFERRAVTLGTLSGFTSQKSVS